ncbi:hypothetical protein CT0861_02188 [Colletotrichum tofieldiae]|uniref:Uncharacterized protein n=1 Tax=Colletotrichum tofieldiae TaxID=708197 RepID=A0A161VDB8_9PEZI|nr:hypothetical protein CT0861_02188 [Colletotrichum tofieldiae]
MLTLMAVAFTYIIRESPLPRRAKLNNFILLMLMRMTHINSISRREQGAHTLHLSASLKHLTAQTKQLEKKDIETLNINYLDRGLNYIPLDLTYTKIYIFTDRLFVLRILVIMCLDLRSLYNITDEKRLMIDIISLRELYEKKEILEVRWINRKDNLSDVLTKKALNSALE